MLVDQVGGALHTLPVDFLVVEEIEGSNLSLDVNRFLIHPCW